MKTLAVVIGNNEYYEGAKLNNAVNDAHSIAETFERLGYDIIYKENCKIEDYVDVLKAFDERIKQYDASIFYYAGHGFQVDGENYLASVDCQIAAPNKYHCSKTCITLSEILTILKNNSDKVNIVIIDACRKSFDRGGYNSFTPIQAPKGTLIAFSTSPNEGAKDTGMDGHSIYTGTLLNYIGREWLSVEDLFKKVRKTVYNLTEGTQTTWEHKSLIGDFYFNTGQMVYSLNLPYDETVIKDSIYNKTDNFGLLIKELKSCDWNRQNPAMDKIRNISPQSLNKNQQFILGRNLQQANGYSFSVTNFFDNLASNLVKYDINGENHVLNGILFEIYFDSIGEFRNGKYKKHDFERIFALRKDARFEKSFDFLQTTLEPYREQLFYIPTNNDKIIDVDVLATSENTKDFMGNETTYQVISKICVSTKNITKQLKKYGITGQNALGLKNALSDFLLTPIDLLHLNKNIELSNIAFLTDEQDIF